MASVVEGLRSVGRHLPGRASKHGRKERGTAPERDGQSLSTSSSSPLASPRILSGQSSSTGSVRSPSGSVRKSQARSPVSTSGPAAWSTSSVPEAVSSGSNSSSADCLLLNGSRQSLDRNTGVPASAAPTELGAAAMDLNKLLAGVERFQAAIIALKKQFIPTQPPQPVTTVDQSPALPEVFEERSIDDAIAAARTPRTSTGQGPDVSADTIAGTPPLTPPPIYSDSSEWSSPPSSGGNRQSRLRSDGAASNSNPDWSSDEENERDEQAVSQRRSPSPNDGDQPLQPNSALMEGVKAVLSAVSAVLREHIAMNGTDLFNSAKALYELCIEHERLMPGELPDFPDAVESVSTAFTACVADYAFGDRASPDEDLHNLQENLVALSHTVETLENVNRMEEASASTAAGSLAPGIPRHFLSEEVPKMLRRWSRYTKELATFYQKRAQLEVEYSQKLLKLARSTTDTLSTPDASSLPSYSNIQTSLESDILYGRECIENYSHAVSESVVQPLKELTETLDRVRHDLQSQWQKECRKAEKRKMEALGTMYKARHQYLTSCEEEKAQSQQSNHSLDTAITSKVGDCEEFYKKTISVANEAQEHLSMLHSSAFDHINQHATAAGMRCQECISTSITAAQSLWGVRSKGDIGSPMSPVSPPSHKYLEPVTQLQGMVSSSEVYEFEELQRAGDDIMPSKPSHLQSKGSLAASTEQLESGSSEQSAVVSPVSPIMAWSPTQSKPDLSAAAAAAAAAPPAPAAGTNTASSNGTPNRMRRPVMHSTPEIHRSNAFHARDTATSLRGERSRKVSDPIRHTVINQENSPDTIGRKGSLGGEPLSPLAASMFARAETGTPTLSRRLKQAHLPAATESPTSTPGSVRRKHAEPPKMQRRISMFMGAEMSPEAEMHNFQRLRSPTKCCHCESYVYFSGAECKQCGIACHRKCLQRLSAECLIPQENTAGLGKRIKRAMSTFGINMSSVVTRSSQDVPAIVPACIKEVEERGLSHVGIYRLSGVKSKVEKLCQQFEKDGGKADIKLSTYPPTLIACVLKLFFRQLPEPLLTYKLYTELIKLGQDGFIGDAEDDEQARKHEQTIQKLRAVLARLPAQNFYTTKMLMGHLSIVASHSKVNNMTESNLGIVFGPTIIQPRMKQGEHTSTVRALVDMPHQSKAVEFIIKGFDEIFTADLEPVTLRSVGSAEFLGSQGSLGGSVDDLVGAESADTRFSMLSELDTMCSLLEAVKEQRDIRAAINPGSEQCLPGADATVTDGKAVFSTLLPGEIDQMENALNHIKSESTESGIGSVDESEELIQFVKRRQEVIDQQAQLRQALHQQQGSLTSNSDSSSPSPPPNSTASSTAATNSTDSNGLPVTQRRERKGSLPSSMAVETRPFMQRSQTQANLGRGQLVQSDDFFRQSTEEVIQQRRRIRKESQTRASPSSSRPTSDIVQLDSPAGERQPRLEFIEEKQDAASAENVFSTETPLDAESHLGVTLPTFPESSAELCDTEEEEDDEEDNGSEQAQHEQHLNPHSGLQPITTYVSTGPGKNDVDTTVSVANPLLAASPLKIAAIRENSPSTSGTSGDKTDHEDDKSVDSLSFESDNDDESSVLSFLP